MWRLEELDLNRKGETQRDLRKRSSRVYWFPFFFLQIEETRKATFSWVLKATVVYGVFTDVLAGILSGALERSFSYGVATSIYFSWGIMVFFLAYFWAYSLYRNARLGDKVQHK